MALQRGDDTDFLRGSRRRRKVIKVGNCTTWSELHVDLLESIFERVGAIDYLMCACVCKSWRSVAIDFKQKFMASQGPLVFLKSKRARKHCFFYNMLDKRLYKTTLPYLSGNKCLGFTCGYLVLRDSERTKKKPYIWLVNPFTRHELEFPRPPREYNHVILASLAKSDREFVVIAFSSLHPFVQFRRSGDVHWTVLDCRTINRMIIDAAVFKGKVYVLTSHGAIGILNLNSPPTVTFLHVQSVSATSTHQLVASHEELYLVYCPYPRFHVTKIYKLHFGKMEWEEVILQDEVLFIGTLECPGLSFPTPFEGRRRAHYHRVLYLGDEPKIHFADGHYRALCVFGMLYRLVPAAPMHWEQPDIEIHSACWYFPHLSSSVNSVNED